MKDFAIRWVVRAAWGLVVSLALSMTGAITPLGDSLAAFRLHMLLPAALVVPLLVFAHHLRSALILSATLIMAGLPVARSGLGPVPLSTDLTLHQQNLRFDNKNVASFIHHMRDTRPDAITLQEVSGHQNRILDEIGEEYPHFQMCGYATGSVGVLARDLGPRIGGGCAEQAELAWITLDTPRGPLTIASLHMFWPWPKPQAAQIAYFEPVLAALPGQVVIGGDFNNVAWSAIVGRIAGASTTQPAAGLAPTYVLFGLWPGLRIDHVLIPMGATAEVTRQPRLGSDHYGLRARIDLKD